MTPVEILTHTRYLYRTLDTVFKERFIGNGETLLGNLLLLFPTLKYRTILRPHFYYEVMNGMFLWGLGSGILMVTLVQGKE